MSENLEVITGYFKAVKQNKDPKNFVQLSYVEYKVVGKDLWKVHAEKVKGKEISIEIVSETEQTMPFKRTLVQFKLNGELYQAVIVREKKPETNPELLVNWVNENGKAGINPCSIKSLSSI